MENKGVLERLIVSPANYWLGLGWDIFLSASTIIAVFVTTSRHMTTLAATLVVGWGTFSFLEYSFHRWLYHTLRSTIKRLHAEHRSDRCTASADRCGPLL